MPPASVGTGSSNPQNLPTTTHAEPPNRSNISLLRIPSKGGSHLLKTKASRIPQAIESTRTKLLNHNADVVACSESKISRAKVPTPNSPMAVPHNNLPETPPQTNPHKK